jgi:hypothetical protein
MTDLRSTCDDCRGKIRYGSMGAARKVIVDVKRRDPRRGGSHGLVMQAFYCPHCSGFHIGRNRTHKEGHMTRDEHRTKCIEAIDSELVDTAHLSRNRLRAQRIFDALHGIAVVFAATDKELIVSLGDLTNPPEGEP